MAQPIQTNSEAAAFFAVLKDNPRRWLTPAAIVAGLSVVLSLAQPKTWEASQALIVRDEAAANAEGPGRFRHSEELKATQETILEIAKSPSVLSAALLDVESVGTTDANWQPSGEQVERLAAAVRLVPPNGAEFGTTEVFYLKVRDHGRDKAVALADAICRHLQARLQQLRDDKAQSMIGEIAKTASLAAADLDTATARLSALESQVGSDLAELRALHESASADSDLRRKLVEVENELRQAEDAQRSNVELLNVLTAARSDQAHLLATPNRLLDAQPALRRLKDGLVDAQLRSAQLRGSMTDKHPLVQAALDSEEEVKQHLRSELTTAVRGAEVELRLSTERVANLTGLLGSTRARLERLAGLRAQYSNLVADVRNRQQVLEAAQKNLADARSSQASAQTASLIATIDKPETGAHPIGPRRATIVLFGLLGGLSIGAGVVYLTVSPVHLGAPESVAQPAAPVHAPRSVLPQPAGVADFGRSLKRALGKVASNGHINGKAAC